MHEWRTKLTLGLIHALTELMSGQDFEVEVRFPNVGKKRNGVSDEGNLMRKSMETS